MAVASAQNFLVKPDSVNMHLTLFKTVLFILSVAPFCWAVGFMSNYANTSVEVCEFSTTKLKTIIYS